MSVIFNHTDIGSYACGQYTGGTYKTKQTNGVSFAYAVKEAAKTNKYRPDADFDEEAFRMVGPSAPRNVKEAWMAAAKEVNTNGLGMQKNGMMSHISQMMVQRLEKMLRGENVEVSGVLGTTTESAIRAAQEALYDLDHPRGYTPRSIAVQQARMKEREFYVVFLNKLQQSGKAGATAASNLETYKEHLRAKYGNVTVKSVGKDQKSLDRIGKSMRGNDVVIAPNILEQMANDPAKAAYYEGKIDDFFRAIPGLKASFAAKGLVYEPGGVVIHEDGTVTYICGCSDSPERVAEVNAINKAKREKQAAQRKASLERSQEEAERRIYFFSNHASGAFVTVAEMEEVYSQCFG